MENRHTFPEPGSSLVRRYGIGLFAAAGAMGIRLVFMPMLGTKPPYITFYLGIVVAAAYGGLGPGLLATCIGALFGVMVLPAGPVVIEQEIVRLVLYALSGVGICLIADAMHKQRRKVLEQAQELQRAHDHLALMVQERTEELRRKELLLELQSRQAVMGEMINNIAHQWRQPLNSLALIIQVLPLGNDDGKLSQDYLEERVERGMEIINHMSQTIEDFLDYFNPDTVTMSFHASEVVARTIRLTEDLFKKFHVSIEVSVSVDPVIVGSPNQFRQVLLNLLLNARDAAVEREVSLPKILISIGKENERGVITVADNAGGIPSDILDKIFEPYFTTKGSDRGTGIGLFMSKAIIERMGGKLEVRNVDNGAEFRIELDTTQSPPLAWRETRGRS